MPWLLWLMWILVALFFLSLTFEDSASLAISVFLAIATQWVPVAVFVVVTFRTRFERWDVIFATAGVTISAVGDTYYSLAMDADGYLVFPSYADIGYVLFYPLMLLALVALVRRQTTTGIRSVVLDTTVSILGAASVLAVLLAPVLITAVTDVSFIEGAVSAAYPLFDLVLISVIFGIATSPRLDIGPRWQWLVLGLLVFAAADVAYALMENEGTYVAGTPLDGTWALGVALIAWWGAGLDRKRAAPPRAVPRRILTIPAPAIAVVLGLGVLVVGTQIEVPLLALVLAGATVGLASIPVMFHQAALARLVAGQENVVKQLTDLDRAKNELLVTMNHELRTPLTSIRGYLEIVRDGDGGELPPHAADMLKVVAQNADRLQGLVDDMATLAGLQANIAHAARSAVDLNSVLSNVVGAQRAAAESRRVELELIVSPTIPIVQGNAAQLADAFEKLIENAIKFTPAGGEVRVDIETEPTDDVPVAAISVVDTGMGIPEDELPQLFSPFFRASNAQTAAVPGTGLGLPIVASIIDGHGGRLTVTSTVGTGTTIRVLVPLSESTL